MNNHITYIPLAPNLYQHYIDIGIKAYNQHYRHLWPNGDTTTYLTNSFTKEVLLREELDDNTSLFLIAIHTTFIGILKFTYNKAIENYDENEACYIDKIYILKEYARKGIGRKTIEFMVTKAKLHGKKVIFLDAMQKGPALNFYVANGFSILNTTKVPFKNVLEEEKPMYTLLKQL